MPPGAGSSRAKATKTEPIISAGIVVHRSRPDGHNVFLVHPGGPFWRNKDEHGWSIPKGEVDPPDSDETPASVLTPTAIEAAARREFVEETGQPVPPGDLVALPELKIGSKKMLRAFLITGDVDPDAVSSNTFEMEWPPRSGRMQSFPEVDRGAWFDLDEARTKLHKGQVPLVDHILEALGRETHPQD